MIRSFFIVSLFLFASFAHAKQTPVIVVFGDSLSAAYGIKPSEGWVNLLQKRLVQQGYKHKVVNASISGETTMGGLTRLPRVLEVHQPALLIIALGANDGLRGLSTQQMRQNLEKMVTMARENNSKVLLIGMQIPPNYGPVYTRQFSKAFEKVSAHLQTPLIPFLLDGIGDKREYFQPDQLHPTARAQPILLDNLWKTIKKLLQS